MTAHLPAAVRRRPVLLVLAVVLLVVGVSGLVRDDPGPGGDATGEPAPDTAPDTVPGPVDVRDLGPRVVVIDPGMPLDEVQARVDAISAVQTDDEMGEGRWAVLFEPGTYGTREQPLQLTVGYYTEVAGLGESPEDVVVHGKIEVRNRCFDGGEDCTALVNFWRTLANLTIEVDGSGQDDCRSRTNTWAVSQASSVRRVVVRAEDGPATLALSDTCSAGPQHASGGFIADSVLDEVVNGSQQQWLTRNSTVSSWTGAVWNQVFAGVEGAPGDATFPDPPYTTLDRTPLTREKPWLLRTADGSTAVRVPDARTQTTGVSWDQGPTEGRTIPLGDFLVADPSTTAAQVNDALARGRHLLLTPGVHDVDETIRVDRAGTVVLGLGHATLTAVDGVVAMAVADVPGVVLAGITVDAGPQESPVLLRIGTPDGASPDRQSRADDPTTLSDVYLRVGGPHVGRADVALQVDADHVLLDHTWVWRADHGAEGFDPAAEDDQRWWTNTGRTGVVVGGDDVTATGLFVEHFQEHDTVWDGERGTTIFYQAELAYDPPSQADWMDGDIQGWAGYRVGDEVQTHLLLGGGVYAFNRSDPGIHTRSGFAAPDVPGVRLRHLRTVSLGAGTIDHVVDEVGGAASGAEAGRPVYLDEW